MPRACHFQPGINGQSCRPLIFRLLVPLVTTLQALAIVNDAFVDNAACCAASRTACQSAKERAQNASHGGSYSRKECRTYCGTRACTYLKACCPSDSARRPANPCGAIQLLYPPGLALGTQRGAIPSVGFGEWFFHFSLLYRKKAAKNRETCLAFPLNKATGLIPAQVTAKGSTRGGHSIAGTPRVRHVQSNEI